MRTVFLTLLLVVLSCSAASAQQASRAVNPLFEGRAPDSIAQSLVDAYYEVLWADDIRKVPVVRREECQSTSLSRCFGGEMDCAWWGTMCDATSYALQRGEVVAQLQSLRDIDPTSDFIAGQLVSFAIKDGDPNRAIRAAESCAGTRWWCQALRGYANHALSPGSGQVHLDSAAVSAPPDALAFSRELDPVIRDRGLRCEWSDPGVLLPDAPASEDPPCAGRSALSQQFWWLSDPLWSEPGNARHSEHIARLIAARLMYERGWYNSSDSWWWQPHNLQEEWVRNGFYNSWRKSVRSRASGPDTTHALYVEGGYSFTPDAERLANPMASTSSDWAVEWNQGPERMITAEEWHLITEEQTNVLRRGDSLLVLSAARLPIIASSLEAVEAAVAMGRPSDRVIRTQAAHVSSTGVVRGQVDLEAGDWIASLEILGRGWVGRARFGAPAPELNNGFGISGPMLVSAAAEADSLALADVMLPSSTVRSRVGVYVEVYGIESGEVVDVRMSLEKTERSFFGRLSGLLGFGSDAAMEVAWSETANVMDEGYTPILVAADVSALEGGEYTLSIGVEADSRRSAEASRRIWVVPAGR